MKLNNKGFSLVELMVVVAIIGILASVAVPSINKYMAKARQAEAKTNLDSLYTAEKAFAAEYTRYHTAFQAVGFAPEGKLRYNIGFSALGVNAGANEGYIAPGTVDPALFSALLYCTGTANLAAGTGRDTCLLLNGSYDDKPDAKSLVSTYRNLLHHYTHQTGNPDAATFWAGLGAIRKKVFQDIGGFDAERFRRPSIEDIELGYRLKRAGHSIMLDRGLQAKHLKEWTLKSIVMTDVFCRAIPWTQLILERGQVEADLNLKFGQRASGALVLLATILLPLCVWQPALLWAVVSALLIVVGLNLDLYAFFRRVGGVSFAVACVPLHFLYLLYSTLSYLYVRVRHFLGRARSPTVSPPRGDK